MTSAPPRKTWLSNLPSRLGLTERAIRAARWETRAVAFHAIPSSVQIRPRASKSPWRRIRRSWSRVALARSNRLCTRPKREPAVQSRLLVTEGRQWVSRSSLGVAHRQPRRKLRLALRGVPPPMSTCRSLLVTSTSKYCQTQRVAARHARSNHRLFSREPAMLQHPRANQSPGANRCREWLGCTMAESASPTRQ